MVGWTGKIDEWLNGDLKNGLLDGYKKWMVGCMDRKTDGWLEGRITNVNMKQMDGWMDG